MRAWWPSASAREHRELVLRPDAALLLPALADAFDEPFADSSALPTYLVSQLAAETSRWRSPARAATSSSAATTRTSQTSSRPCRRPRDPGPPAGRAAAELERACQLRLQGEALRPRRAPTAARAPPRLEGDFLRRARAELSGRSDFDPVDLYRSRFAETEGAEPLARLQDVDLGIYLVDDLLVKTDRAWIAHSLEARVPFLDPVVTNFALALPPRHRVSGLRKKVLLRKAVAPLVPSRIVRGKKRGFSIPAAAWLRGELEPFARETLSPETLRRQGYFRPRP